MITKFNICLRFHCLSIVHTHTHTEQLSPKSGRTQEEIKAKKGLFPVEELLDDTWEWLRWQWGLVGRTRWSKC